MTRKRGDLMETLKAGIRATAPKRKRTKKRVKRQGKRVKSVMLRVDANFADWARKQDGSVTEVTRKLHQQILESQDGALARLLVAQHITGGAA